LIDAHRGAFEYDWRTRFGQSLRVVGRSMAWGEALRLTSELARDPGSRVGAALAGWDYPVSQEALVVMNLFDLTHQIAWAQGGGKGSRPKPHPRPWPDRSKKIAKPTVSQEQVLAALRMAGHTGEPPSLN
jgi:hypothetical protein